VVREHATHATLPLEEAVRVAFDPRRHANQIQSDLQVDTVVIPVGKATAPPPPPPTKEKPTTTTAVNPIRHGRRPKPSMEMTTRMMPIRGPPTTVIK
jgi:hypothetical protein